MKSFVCGFAFDKGCRNVALIEKKRPEFMNGMLNGIGGKLEFNESLTAAMTREFFEETGLIVHHWILFAQITHLREDIIVFFFFTFLEETCDNYTLSQTTDEKPVWVKVKDINNLKVIDDLKWLIPVAMTPNKTIIKGMIDSSVPVESLFSKSNDVEL